MAVIASKVARGLYLVGWGGWKRSCCWPDPQQHSNRGLERLTNEREYAAITYTTSRRQETSDDEGGDPDFLACLYPIWQSIHQLHAALCCYYQQYGGTAAGWVAVGENKGN